MKGKELFSGLDIKNCPRQADCCRSTNIYNEPALTTKKKKIVTGNQGFVNKTKIVGFNYMSSH